MIVGFQTLGTGNRYVGNWTKFMYAAGKGAADRVISLPGNLKDAIGGAILLGYDLVTETSATVGQAKAKVTGIAVQAMAIASDPHGTYEKVMDQMTAMGEDGLLSAAGEMTGGAAFDFATGGLTKGLGIGGKALAMAQETKVGRAIAKGYEEARGAVQSAKEFGSGFKQGWKGYKSTGTYLGSGGGGLQDALDQAAHAFRQANNSIGKVEKEFITLFHGTSSNRASKIVGNKHYPTQGFRNNWQVFFAEEKATASHFAKSQWTIPGNDAPRSFSVITFKIPKSLAEELGLTVRKEIGGEAFLNWVDIEGGTGFERVLSNVDKFNEALKSGEIKASRERLR